MSVSRVPLLRPSVAFLPQFPILEPQILHLVRRHQISGPPAVSAPTRLSTETRVRVRVRVRLEAGDWKRKDTYRSILHCKYSFAWSRHSGAFVPRCARKQRRYDVIRFLHSPVVCWPPALAHVSTREICDPPLSRRAGRENRTFMIERERAAFRSGCSERVSPPPPPPPSSSSPPLKARLCNLRDRLENLLLSARTAKGAHGGRLWGGAEVVWWHKAHNPKRLATASAFRLSETGCRLTTLRPWQRLFARLFVDRSVRPALELPCYDPR